MGPINLYVIGAGRSVAGDPDDNDERMRQRRLTSAQRAEQERRGAALREQFAQTEHATAAIASQQRTEHPRPNAPSRSVHALPSKRTADHLPPGHLPSPSEGDRRPLRYASSTLRDSNQPPLDKPELFRPDLMDDYLKDMTEMFGTPAPHQHVMTSDPSPALEFQPDPAERQAGDELIPACRVSMLIDSLDELRGPQFADRLASQLEGIMRSVQSDRQLRLHQTEGNEAHSALDFLEGYIEAGAIKEADRQRLIQLVSELRDQFPSESLLSPAKQALVSSAVAVSHRVADSGRAVGVGDLRSNVRNRSQAVERRTAAEEETEIDGAPSGQGASSLRLDLRGPASASKSSLSKDADKRREETLVTVTVRSV